MFSPDDVKSAARMFYSLLEKGEITDKDPLFTHARRQEVLDCLFILADEAEMNLNYEGSAVYLVARSPFTIFSCSNEDIRNMFKVSNDDEEKSNKFLYTCYFLIMVLLSEFYSSSNYTAQSRDFISFKELFRRINDVVRNISSMTDIQEVSDSMQVRFVDAANYWESINIYDTRATRRAGTARADQMAYLRKVLEVLQSSKFIKIDYVGQSDLSDNSIIYVTPKLTGFITAYYSNEERRSQILNFISERMTASA